MQSIPIISWDNNALSKNKAHLKQGMIAIKRIIIHGSSLNNTDSPKITIKKVDQSYI